LVFCFEEKEEFIMTLSSSFSSLRTKIGQMIMIGFTGSTPTDPEVTRLKQYAEEGLIGGFIFFSYNITTPQQLKTLTDLFKHTTSPLPLLLAVDQEGGKVQRLSAKNGFKNFMSAAEVSQQGERFASSHYTEMAKMVTEAGFNMVLGPVVDLRNDPKSKIPSPAIGTLDRSYGSSPETVCTYARCFIDAFHNYQIRTTLKHFPGHGYAQKDSHKSMVDITTTHHPSELEPFYQLMAEERVDAIMTGHLINHHYDSDYPATLSQKTLTPLLRDKGYQGVIISDCLNMGAIEKHYPLEEIIIKTIQAGVDILLFSNNTGVHVNTTQESQMKSSQLVEKIIFIIEAALKNGSIDPRQIEDSYQRIRALKMK
jgi:beta-N-acetylhexosaminidase